ncbi:MAG: glycosyltransferase family 1 protein [Actinomycetota bacterium]|nr:glycosyltransferase family 1 protein [Actinomycetota bacterium]
MRVAIAAESFSPRVNGVANSVVQVARELHKRAIPSLIIAPDSYPTDDFEGIPVHRVRSFELPGAEIDIALPRTHHIASVLEEFGATVVHLASPMALGRKVLNAARMLHIPSVAIFQTHISGFANHYRLGSVSFLADGVIRRIHQHADLTLAPSRASELYLKSLQVDRIRLWGRGVDLTQFSPLRHVHSALVPARSAGMPRVGFVGRLAPEKNVHILAELAAAGELEVLVVGDGPSREELQRLMPRAQFTGRLLGLDLAAAFASLDVLVASGELETFCQVIQEAMASGVPVVAPRTGGPLDLIEDGRTGLLYTPGSRASMKEQVCRLLGDEPLRNAIVEAAQQQVAERSWHKLTDELIGHYADASMAYRLNVAA